MGSISQAGKNPLLRWYRRYPSYCGGAAGIRGSKPTPRAQWDARFAATGACSRACGKVMAMVIDLGRVSGRAAGHGVDRTAGDWTDRFCQSTLVRIHRLSAPAKPMAWEWQAALNPDAPGLGCSSGGERSWEFRLSPAKWRRAFGSVRRSDTAGSSCSHSRPTRDDAGRIVKWCGAATDVDDQLEIKLETLQRRLSLPKIVNVGGHSAPFDDLSVIIVHRTAMDEEPAIPSVSAAKASLHFAGLTGEPDRLPAVEQFWQVFRVDRCLPLPAMGFVRAQPVVFGPSVD